MGAIITEEYGQIKLNDVLVPGILENSDADCTVRLDTIQMQGASGTQKQFGGYDDGKFALNLILTTDSESDTCYDKLKVIQGLFRKTDEQSKCIPYRLINVHANTREITKVLLTGLRSSETNSSDTLKVSLDFVEYKPITVKMEEQKGEVTSEQAGTGNKIDKSPIKDDAEAKKA